MIGTGLEHLRQYKLYLMSGLILHSIEDLKQFKSASGLVVTVGKACH